MLDRYKDENTPPLPATLPARQVEPYKLSYERKKESFDEDLQSMSHYSTCGMFCAYSYRDVGRRKCTFCLSLCSVLFVVWATLIINTMVDKGPVVFLKLAEATTGEFDATIFQA